jgi:hypothetical protein
MRRNRGRKESNPLVLSEKTLVFSKWFNVRTTSHQLERISSVRSLHVEMSEEHVLFLREMRAQQLIKFWYRFPMRGFATAASLFGG